MIYLEITEYCISFASYYNSVITVQKYKKFINNTHMEVEKKILVALGEKKVLKEMFGTTFYTVRNALNGQGSKITVIGLKIRLAAIERGGLEVEPKKTEAV